MNENNRVIAITPDKIIREAMQLSVEKLNSDDSYTCQQYQNLVDEVKSLSSVNPIDLIKWIGANFDCVDETWYWKDDQDGDCPLYESDLLRIFNELNSTQP